MDETENDGDIGNQSVLVFLPGLHEIQRVYRQISSYLKKEKKYKYFIQKIHSSIPRDASDMKKLMTPTKDGSRKVRYLLYMFHQKFEVKFKILVFEFKVILSTNICESSITIPDIVHVIDFCMTKQMEKNDAVNLQQLILKWTSHESCDQRKGEAVKIQAGNPRMVGEPFKGSC